MSNSMLKECNWQILANTALMNAAANHSLEIFVEGDDDRTCLSRFVNKQKVNIIVSGKKDYAINALKAYISSKKKNKKSAIAIADADHDHILKTNHGLKELFLTDDHDLLIQAINSNIALEAILHTERRKIKEDISIFRQNLFTKCTTLGYLRLINTEDGLNISFKNALELLKITDEEELANQIKIQQPDLQITKESLATRLKNKKIKPLPLNQLCNGHDASLLLMKFFRDSEKNKTSGIKIEKSLMMSYDFRCFKKTKLHKNLKKWGKENLIKIFET